MPVMIFQRTVPDLETEVYYPLWILNLNLIRIQEGFMKVIRIAEVETVPIATATPIPGWTGGDVKRTRQPILPEGASKHFNSSIVNVERGATTGWHVHKSDQILVVTAGIGMVANEHEEREITVGDVVHILEGENHWHGAKADSYMSHITITAAD